MIRTLVLVTSLEVASFAFADNAFVQVVQAVVSSFDHPFFVVAFLCNRKASFGFLRSLSEHYVAASVQSLSTEPFPKPLLSNHVLYVLDFSCENRCSFLYRASQEDVFASPYRWLIIVEDANLTPALRNNLSSLNILVDSEIIVAERTDNVYVITKVYKRRQNLPLVEERVGMLKTEPRQWITKDNEATSRRRKNLMGTILNSCIVVTHNDTLNHLTDKRDKHIDTITKVNYALVQHLSDIVNATLNYSIQNTWGYKGNDSQWSGMIGELQRHEADIGGTPLFVTADRVSVIDYVSMTSKTRSKFVFRQPKLSYVSNVYVLPFHWSVWVSLFATVIITAISLYCAARWELHWKSCSNYEKLDAVQDPWMDATMLVYAAMCQQGASFVPYGVPGRIITILTFTVLMFLYTSYSANIVALLQSPSNSIQTLNDLLHSRLDVGVDDTVFNHFYFPNEQEPVRRAIYLQKVAPPGQKPRFFNMSEGVERMRHEHFAFHMEIGVGYDFVRRTFEEHEKCGLQEIQFLQVPDPWIALQKNTSFKEILKIGFRQLHETGLQARENSLLYTKRPICTNHGSSFVSVGIIDCYLAAVVLLGGIIISATIFMGEISISSKLQRKLVYFFRERLEI